MFSAERMPSAVIFPLISPAKAAWAGTRPKRRRIATNVSCRKDLIVYLDYRNQSLFRRGRSRISQSESEVDASHKPVGSEKLGRLGNRLLPPTLVLENGLDVGADQNLEARTEAVAREMLREAAAEVQG